MTQTNPPLPAMQLQDAVQIAGAAVAVSRLVGDARGEFARLFDGELLDGVHQARPIVQVNRSMTRMVGAVRGMHYQTAPALEAKWVRCLRGRVFDVLVDLRAGSPTFLKHFAIELSAEAGNALFIPEGCAHGFQVLEADSELLYLHTAPYASEHEGGLRCDDPALGIAWPLPVAQQSDRDRGFALIDSNFKGIAV